jgi:DnaK suppressor protein
LQTCNSLTILSGLNKSSLADLRLKRPSGLSRYCELKFQQTRLAVKKKENMNKKAAKIKVVRKPTRRRKNIPVYTKTSEYLTAEEIAYYKNVLLEKMHEIIGDVNSIEDEALKKSRLDATGDLSSMPIHMADIGTDNYEQEFSLNLLDSERKIFREINEALQRIEEGTYGICEITGRGISKARLEARPWARYCMAYAKLVEKGIIREGDPVPDGVELD